MGKINLLGMISLNSDIDKFSMVFINLNFATVFGFESLFYDTRAYRFSPDERFLTQNICQECFCTLWYSFAKY